MSDYVFLDKISKHFGEVYALKEVSLDLQNGEILGLVGENGAGKSTLIKVLTGAYKADGGKIVIDGTETMISSPSDGRQNGIGVMYQEFSLANDLTVAENIFLHKVSKELRVNWSEIQHESRKILDRLGFEIDPGALVEELNVAQKQIVEIAKALSEKVKVLILDEPTTVLTPNDVAKLHEIMLNLRNSGISLVYISHRLEDILEITDRVAILKDGEMVGVRRTSDMDSEKMISMMIGRDLTDYFPEKNVSSEEVLFEVKNLCKSGEFKNISFEVKRGEVFGFAGLVGSGRSEVMKAIISADGGYDSGSILIHGSPIKANSIGQAVANGIGLVPEDRKEEGVLLSEPIRVNLTLPVIKKISNIFSVVKKSKEQEICKKEVQRFQVRTTSSELEVGKLSGGNQQKVALAKWFASETKVILLDEPTRGVDVGAKAEIYRLIAALAKNGVAVVIVSSELIEIIGICNRVAVMAGGQIAGFLEQDELTEKKIISLAIKGQSNDIHIDP